MQRKFLLVLIIMLTSGVLFSQPATDSLLKLGNVFYRQSQFAQAASVWEQAAELADNKLSKNTNYSYAASAYASAKDSINSLRCLDSAIAKYGFNNLPDLKNDDAYLFLHGSTRWKKLISSIKPTYTANPLKVQVVDKDVSNFWNAYDMVKKNPSLAEKIYRDNYFSKGTMALQFYYLNKIRSVNNFIALHDARKKYYKSIRANTFKAARLKSSFIKSFLCLQKIYPQAIFPNIYFVIGKLNSAGTVSSDGLILGIDQACMSPDADTTELNTWEKHNISTFQNLPHTVAHELIHYEQNGMAGDTTLLHASIVEGMADFIGELISGKTANERLHVFAIGKEKIIWQNFKKEMYLNRADNWIANSEQETADMPADLGYWVGYKICKAYYNEFKNKKKAIYNMLHIQDYKKFLEQSKLEEKFN